MIKEKGQNDVVKYYINFDGRDKRYDRWVVAGELERIQEKPKSAEKQTLEQN